MSDCLPIDTVPEPFDPAPSPEALAIHEDQRARLLDLFTTLFGLYDACILTALYLDEMTAREVATRYARTEHQIDYIRRKALRALRNNADIRALLCPTATR